VPYLDKKTGSFRFTIIPSYDREAVGRARMPFARMRSQDLGGGALMGAHPQNKAGGIMGASLDNTAASAQVGLQSRFPELPTIIWTGGREQVLGNLEFHGLAMNTLEYLIKHGVLTRQEINLLTRAALSKSQTHLNADAKRQGKPETNHARVEVAARGRPATLRTYDRVAPRLTFDDRNDFMARLFDSQSMETGIPKWSVLADGIADPRFQNPQAGWAASIGMSDSSRGFIDMYADPTLYHHPSYWWGVPGNLFARMNTPIRESFGCPLTSAHMIFAPSNLLCGRVLFLFDVSSKSHTSFFHDWYWYPHRARILCPELLSCETQSCLSRVNDGLRFQRYLHSVHPTASKHAIER
jgi:hypothetical protein